MPDTGAPFNLRFPASTDPPNGAQQIENLARDVAARLPNKRFSAGTIGLTFPATAPKAQRIAHGLGVVPSGASATFVEDASDTGGFVINPAKGTGMVWDATYFWVKAFTPAGAPYIGTLSQVEWIAWV